MCENFVSDCFYYMQARVFKSSGACAAFLANYDTSSSAKVSFGNVQYDLPPWSISILPDCKTAAYNTAKVRRIRLIVRLAPQHPQMVLTVYQKGFFFFGVIFCAYFDFKQLNSQSSQKAMTPAGTRFSWQSYREESATSNSDKTFIADGLREQINVTWDKSDYLWYMTE